MKKQLSLLALLLLSFQLAHAKSLEWSPIKDLKVEEVQVNEGGRIWVKVNQMIDGTGGCVRDFKMRVASTASDSGKDLMMRILIAAKLTNRSISVRVRASNQTCWLHEVSLR